MIRVLLMLVAVVTFSCMASGQTVVAEDEAKLVRVPLENYLRAQATGNGELIRKAFHPDARIMSFRGDKFNNLSVDEFAGMFKGKVADDESRRERRIESVDISGTAAVARLVLDYPGVRFVDFMSLLKIGGEWKIVSKTFFAELKPQK